MVVDRMFIFCFILHNSLVLVVLSHCGWTWVSVVWVSSFSWMSVEYWWNYHSFSIDRFKECNCSWGYSQSIQVYILVAFTALHVASGFFSLFWELSWLFFPFLSAYCGILSENLMGLGLQPRMCQIGVGRNLHNAKPQSQK